MAKAFQSFTTWVIRRSILRVSYDETQKMRTAKFFWHWTHCFEKNRKENGAVNVLGFSKLHNVLNAWRQVTEEEKTIRAFRAGRDDTRVKRLTIKGF